MDGEKPRHLPFHENDSATSELPMAMVNRSRETEWLKKILAECQIFDRDVFDLIEQQRAIEEKL